MSDKRMVCSLGGFARVTARNRQASFGDACHDSRLWQTTCDKEPLMPKFLSNLRKSATQKLLHGMLRMGRWLGPGGAMTLGKLVGWGCGFAGPLPSRLAANF